MSTQQYGTFIDSDLSPSPAIYSHRAYEAGSNGEAANTMAQFWPKAMTISPEHSLLLAMIERTVADLSDRKPRKQAQAVEWLESNDEIWPYSCENICMEIGISRSAMIAALKARFPQAWTHYKAFGTSLAIERELIPERAHRRSRRPVANLAAALALLKEPILRYYGEIAALTGLKAPQVAYLAKTHGLLHGYHGRPHKKP